MLETCTPQQGSAFSFVLLLVALCPGIFTPWGNADQKDLVTLMQRTAFVKQEKDLWEGEVMKDSCHSLWEGCSSITVTVSGRSVFRQASI